jgi:hypothetical protein
MLFPIALVHALCVSSHFGGGHAVRRSIHVRVHGLGRQVIRGESYWRCLLNVGVLNVNQCRVSCRQ